jgi:TRAP-type C4-dicarboxylate transport system permease large subunit
MKPENMPKADFVVSILLMLFSLWLIAHSLQMPRFEDIGANPFSAPGIVPGVLGTVVFFLSLVVFVRAMRQKGYRLRINRETLVKFLADPSTRRMLLTTIFCVIYGLAMIGHMNYYLATFVFVLSFLLLFQYRASASTSAHRRLLLTALSQAALTATIVGVVFRYLFLVDLP